MALLKSATIRPNAIKYKISTFWKYFFKIIWVLWIFFHLLYLLWNQTETCHSVYSAELTGKSVCVTADDNHVFILLLHVSIICNETLYVRQGTTSSRDGITYDNVNLLSWQLGEKICAILPVFHSLTGSNFTKLFFGRSKINSFKKLLSKPESMDSMSSMDTDLKLCLILETDLIQSPETRKITWR